MLDLIVSLLSLGNFILAAALIVTTFALLIYLFPQNVRHPVQRSFSALLLFVGIVYVGQVFLLKVDTRPDAEWWLRFKWIGIAFVPAAYLHFSDAVLRSTYHYSRWRHLVARISYVIGAVFLVLVLNTDLVVQGLYDYPAATQLGSGRFFGLFAVYFFATTIWGLYNIDLARRRSLTPTSRRRLGRLAIAFLAPALGVFPYLVIAGFAASLPPVLLLGVTFFGTIGLVLMLVVMAYTVAYQGALASDRIVKQKLIHYLLRGPVVALGVVIALTVVPPIERYLHLSHESFLYATVIVGVIVFELLVSRVKPYLDRWLFIQDRREIGQIQQLEARLLTTTDLRQLLENILAALCDLLRVPSGFVLAAAGEDWRLEATVGPREGIQQFLSAHPIADTFNGTNHHLVPAEGYWLYPLRVNGGDMIVGVLGLAARSPTPELSDHERELLDALASQAEIAIEDRQLQLSVFDVLEQIGSEVELLQRARTKPRVVGATAQERVEEELVLSPDFHRAVKDALDHYWGGPKLTHSPLLQLNIVKSSLSEYDQNPARALRAILLRAIEQLKPEGTRSLTAPEWLLYNILELKVVQGHKVREIAQKLAMSESDLYRKQRVAIQEVAKAVQQMENQDTRPPRTDGAPGAEAEDE
ncbi:MAG: histidine kinase N-terminal 7TM domain-containing protein [Anaerolineae bacterium]